MLKIGSVMALSRQSVEAGRLKQYADKSRLSNFLDSQLMRPDSQIIKSIGITLKKLGLGVNNKDIVGYFREKTPSTLMTTSGISSTVPPPSIEPITQPPSAPSSPLTPGDQKNLAELYALGLELRGGRAPSKLVFPDGSSVSVKSWKDVVIGIVTWFGNKEQLPKLPFRGPSRRSKRWFLNTAPQHESGARMESACPINLQNQTIYIETNWSSSDLVQRLEALCMECGESPSGFVISMQ